MTDTEENLIGLKVRHKDYKIGDLMGQYTIGYNLDGSTLGLWFQMNSSRDCKLQFSSYSLSDITRNIDNGSWIPIISEVINDYQIY